MCLFKNTVFNATVSTELNLNVNLNNTQILWKYVQKNITEKSMLNKSTFEKCILQEILFGKMTKPNKMLQIIASTIVKTLSYSLARCDCFVARTRSSGRFITFTTGLYRDVWIAAITWSRTSQETQTAAIMCLFSAATCTSQCKLRSLRANPLWSIDGVYIRESLASSSIAMVFLR